MPHLDFRLGRDFFLTIQAKHKAKATGSRERERDSSKVQVCKVPRR